MRTIVSIVVLLFLAIVGYGTFRLTTKFLGDHTPTVGEQTKENCRYGAELTKPAFKGTQFENYDFYQSCIDNILYANPMNRR
ncbi:MAG: hypothetical protein KCHDKBKB_00670 [Elusimicrobia bacterium]|nr:hypothetical protein [Elusimicrobiota bacterium]